MLMVLMEAEMDDHLGYEKSERFDSDDYRNAVSGFQRTVLRSKTDAMRSERTDL